jgi:energy-coupling factor transport system permease protein
MQLLMPLEPDPSAPLARANPVAKLAAALVLLVALFASLDGVTASLILVVLVALVPVSGLTVVVLLRRWWLILGLAVSVGAFNVLFAAEQLGPTVLALGPVRIGADTLLNGVGLALRLVGIAMVGLLALATLRLLPMLGHEWQLISMARRARGVDAGRNPIAAIGLFGGQLLSLLIGAVRRAGRMAQAMEARGFGALPERTVARVQTMRAADWLLVAGAIGLAALAIGVSIALGTWRPLLG